MAPWMLHFVLVEMYPWWIALFLLYCLIEDVSTYWCRTCHSCAYFGSKDDLASRGGDGQGGENGTAGTAGTAATTAASGKSGSGDPLGIKGQFERVRVQSVDALTFVGPSRAGTFVERSTIALKRNQSSAIFVIAQRPRTPLEQHMNK